MFSRWQRDVWARPFEGAQPEDLEMAVSIQPANAMEALEVAHARKLLNAEQVAGK